MIKNENALEKIVSKNFVIIGLASAGCGAFHGFYDGIGIPLPNKFLETYLNFGPCIIQGILGICDGVSIAKKGRQITGNYPSFVEEELKNIIDDKDEEFFINKEVYGGIMGGLGEGIGAGFQTLLGYVAGYMVGRVIKSFS